MAESTPTPGQAYHTKDGKTVFIDPKTGQVSVFEGHVPLEKILEPTLGITPISTEINHGMIETILKELMPGIASFDFIVAAEPVVHEPAPVPSQSDGPVDILGVKQYYVLAPAKGLPLSLSANRISAWVSEYINGHHPEYQGYKKHQILPDQWNWLLDHPKCPILAWYDAECPVFVTLACQAHAKVIKPVSVVDKIISSPEASEYGLSVEVDSIETRLESVLTEERDV